MNLLPFYEAQKELEQVVRENLGMTHEEFTSVGMIDKRIFAFKVELGELANEHGWFKYWKQSHQMDLSKTAEELADCIHFLLAIALYRKYTFIKELNYQQWVSHDFDFLYAYIMESGMLSSAQWKRCFEMILAIGIKVGFDIEQIQLAYLLKNKKNQERQQNNY